MTGPLLEIRGLAVHSLPPEGTRRAVASIDLALFPRQTVGLVGEAGCEKALRPWPCWGGSRHRAVRPPARLDSMATTGAKLRLQMRIAAVRRYSTAAAKRHRN